MIEKTCRKLDSLCVRDRENFVVIIWERKKNTH